LNQDFQDCNDFLCCYIDFPTLQGSTFRLFRILSGRSGLRLFLILLRLLRLLILRGCGVCPVLYRVVVAGFIYIHKDSFGKKPNSPEHLLLGVSAGKERTLGEK
jgi:hypothetical protein